MTRLRLATLAATLALPLALAACGDDDPEPRLPSPSASPSSSSTPSPSPDAATEPTLPPEAEGNDEAAAEAFVRYYYDVINYAQLTGDVKTLRRESLVSCDFCTKGAEYIRDLYAKGGSQVGGGYSVSDARIVLATKSLGIRTFDARVNTDSAPYSTRDHSSALAEEHVADSQSWTLLVTWDRTGFSLGGMNIE